MRNNSFSVGDGLAAFSGALTVVGIAAAICTWQITDHKGDLKDEADRRAKEQEATMARHAEADKIRKHELALAQAKLDAEVQAEVEKLRAKHEKELEEAARVREEQRFKLNIAINILTQDIPRDKKGEKIGFEKGQQALRAWAAKSLNLCTPDNPLSAEDINDIRIGKTFQWHTPIPGSYKRLQIDPTYHADSKLYFSPEPIRESDPESAAENLNE